MPGTFCSHFSGFARYAWVKYAWAATFDDCWYALVTVVKTCQDDIGSGIFVGIAEPTCVLPIQHVTLTSGEVF